MTSKSIVLVLYFIKILILVISYCTRTGRSEKKTLHCLYFTQYLNSLNFILHTYKIYVQKVETQ